MLCSPSRTKPARLSRIGAGLHSPLPHLTLVLPAGCGFSATACMALTGDQQSMLVLRRECGSRLVRDFVLEGRQGSPSKWIGYWLIRLDALRGGIGWTNALILDGRPCRRSALHIETLVSEGAQMHRAARGCSEGRPT